MKLCQNLPPHNAWVEVFCGSAAITLSKPPSGIEIINDLNGEIINLFKTLRNHPKQLERLVALTPYARTELLEARKRPRKRLTNLERARRFLVASMMSMNGAFGEDKGGFSYSDSYSRHGMEARVSRWHSLPDRFSPVIERLRSVRIEKKDALELVKSYVNRPGTLIYLDPPYLANRKNGYDLDNKSVEFHTRLLKAVQLVKAMVFISGYDCELYNRYLTKRHGWRSTHYPTHTRGARGKVHNRIEVVWTNANFRNALKTGRIPVRLTKFERLEMKTNPVRKASRGRRRN